MPKLTNSTSQHVTKGITLQTLEVTPWVPLVDKNNLVYSK